MDTHIDAKNVNFVIACALWVWIGAGCAKIFDFSPNARTLGNNNQCLIAKTASTAALSAVSVNTSPIATGRGLTVNEALDQAYADCKRHGLGNCQSMPPDLPVVRMVFSPEVTEGVVEDMEESNRGRIPVKTFNHKTDDEKEIEATASITTSKYQ